ncbi:hypothetical protein JCM8547_001316 [Rhodosporidiobolus lusitaniae]
MSTASPAPPDSHKSSFRIPTSLEEVLISSVLKTGSATSVQGGKEALSLQSMSVNFRRFVQKSGPIFVVQDAVEAVFLWENPTKTVFFAGCWGFLCYWPTLTLFIPQLALLSILLSTYSAKKSTSGPPPESQDGPTTLAKDPPGEGTVDYLANLQNIQIMMGRVADLTDLLRSLAPSLTWRDERLTRTLLHLSVVSSVLLALFAPVIPWKFVFFLAGEAAFVAGHPLSRTLLKESLPRWRSAQQQKQARQLARRLLEDDGLGDEELEMEVVEVQRLEVESRAPSSEGGWVSEAVVGGELVEGFRWLGEWEDAAPADGAVDAEGWTYIHLDGSRTSTPSVPGEKGPVYAQSRRRRLTRRAIRNSLL